MWSQDIRAESGPRTRNLHRGHDRRSNGAPWFYTSAFRKRLKGHRYDLPVAAAHVCAGPDFFLGNVLGSRAFDVPIAAEIAVNTSGESFGLMLRQPPAQPAESVL